MPLYVILGTSSEVGKTTAGVALVRTLRINGYKSVIAFKATGTSSVTELARYQDFGAAQAFDCVDFGLPTTYPVDRPDISNTLGKALDFCLSVPAHALVVECAGDPFVANTPAFLECLKSRRADVKVILAAGDALGAMGAKQALADIGLSISLITGPCTDSPAMRERTKALCGIPTINMLHHPDLGTR